ncbi:glycosyltransferase family 2 protein [Galbibacter sp. EGI 63066]|uniref:glycosyltransferase family 2 protein n=1 Tax=Galbibacter sp. EGI 63066 TaxID=2993559 RepID=UPI002248F4F9|nr:glycosyltransferase family 2 protein [Galbibacter sp. EGI 63066]MCX2678546.1 glycosyltransferase family 2 protein [Galbibacter sp. EGI 63066]
MSEIKISVIISTYNSEVWLQKVLWGYQNQQFKDFEMVIADDGSGPATKELLEQMKTEVFYPIKHVWQEDDGFQKSKILNKAILVCDALYIVMSDGDCIPRPDFLEIHYTTKREGHFLSGGYFKLPMETSKKINKEDIFAGRCFDPEWLKENGVPSTFKLNKLTKSKRKASMLNFITPTKTTWNGNNSSGWKKDIVAVNGFDERMQYGGQDREMGARMVNNGVKPIQIRYSSTCVHLDHARGYKNKETLARNKAIRKATKEKRAVWTPYGIVKKKLIR